AAAHQDRERAGGGTPALRGAAPLHAFDEQTDRALVARLGETAICVLANHVRERFARRCVAQELAGPRRTGAAEREARLGLDEVARVTLLDDRGERGTGGGLVREI